MDEREKLILKYKTLMSAYESLIMGFSEYCSDGKGKLWVPPKIKHQIKIVKSIKSGIKE